MIRFIALKLQLTVLQHLTCVGLAYVAILQGVWGSCTSGVLQLQAFPVGESGQVSDSCYYDAANYIKAWCTEGARVTVSSGGVIKMVPLVQASYNYTYPYGEAATMNCKDLNASGLINRGSTAAATLMLYDDLGGPLSQLTKTGPHQVTLSTGHAYTGSQRYSISSCDYNYTVVSGCVLSARPPVKPVVCRAGYIVKKGRFNIKYCAPCPPFTSSPGHNSVSCKLCPAGTYYVGYGKACSQCGWTHFKPKAGIDGCKPCPRSYYSARSSGRKCEKCPAGSLPLQKQCYKCQAGKRCCTVNWTSPTGGCPKCAAGTFAATYTSIFAFHSASSPSCLAASNFARCAPKINITVNACKVILSNLAYSNPVDDASGYNNCKWRWENVIKGAKASAKVDLTMLPNGGVYWWQIPDETTTGGGMKVTKVAAPYLTFYTPKDKCTFQYRALTKPAASILGVPPKPCLLGTRGCPSASYACPAGQYRELNTDTKPAPCLVCPPGTYSPKASRASACTPCPVGTYAPGYGSKRCSSCPAPKVAVARGSASCSACDNVKPDSIRASPSSCQACPANTGYYYNGFRSCLANVHGSICCAAGDCTGQVPCNASLPSSSYVEFGAAMQLISADSSLSQASCKNDSFLACLQDNALLAFRSFSQTRTELSVHSITPTKCAAGPFEVTDAGGASGGFVSSKRAILTKSSSTGASFQYEVASNKNQGTLTITLTTGMVETFSVVKTNPALIPSCSATFKLIAGFVFDLTPPLGAQCPANAIPRIIRGRTFCNFCDSGEYKNASSQTCKYCPAGTYENNRGSTSCKKCPPGFYCGVYSSSPLDCKPGEIAPQPGASQCKKCPANTYSAGPKPTTCTKCPPKTISIVGSSACGVPWDK